jgi:DNA-directed RNA polymerase specialized sigma24 family protein
MSSDAVLSFPVTRWTRVNLLRAEPESADGMRALADLCQAYWYPLYAFARRKGQSQEDAQDLVQGFFAYVLTANTFAQASADRGKMRSYLVCLFQRYMMDEWDKRSAKKRGGGVEFTSLDFVDGEQRFAVDDALVSDGERMYDRAWAQDVLLLTGAVLQREWMQAGKGEVYELLQPYIVGDAAELSYEQLGVKCGLSAANLRQMVSRLRSRFRVLLREQIADTLAEPTDEAIDAELQALRAALTK